MNFIQIKFSVKYSGRERNEAGILLRENSSLNIQVERGMKLEFYSDKILR
jgi:hypothetical protein